MTKQELIDEYLKEPLKLGDPIYVKEEGRGRPDRERLGDFLNIVGDIVQYKHEGNEYTVSLSNVRKSVFYIGTDPFAREVRNTTYQFDVEQLLWRVGYDYDTNKDKVETIDRERKIIVPECCTNPMVIVNGEEVEYQRGLVWTEEQKKLLIESMYNHVDIGKFVFRIRSWDWVEKRAKAGKLEYTAFKDLVDGKQRFNAIKDFLSGRISDMHGNYFSEFSEAAQRRFLGYRNMTYVELPENTSDEDTIRTFLAINHTGVPMSKEHIEFVKTLL